MFSILRQGYPNVTRSYKPNHEQTMQLVLPATLRTNECWKHAQRLAGYVYYLNFIYCITRLPIDGLINDLSTVQTTDHRLIQRLMNNDLLQNFRPCLLTFCVPLNFRH